MLCLGRHRPVRTMLEIGDRRPSGLQGATARHNTSAEHSRHQPDPGGEQRRVSARGGGLHAAALGQIDAGEEPRKSPTPGMTTKPTTPTTTPATIALLGTPASRICCPGTKYFTICARSRSAQWQWRAPAPPIPSPTTRSARWEDRHNDAHDSAEAREADEHRAGGNHGVKDALWRGCGRYERVRDKSSDLPARPYGRGLVHGA